MIHNSVLGLPIHMAQFHNASQDITIKDKFLNGYESTKKYNMSKALTIHCLAWSASTGYTNAKKKLHLKFYE